MIDAFSLIKKRLRNFGKLPSAIRFYFRVKSKQKSGYDIYLHPVVFFKVILRLFSAPFFRLDSILLPGELSFEKKLNTLISKFKNKELIDNREYFDFDHFKLFIPKFKDAEKVILNDLREVYLDNVYAKHFLMGKPINEGDTVLDLGANIGGFSLWACSQNDNVTSYAVEPHPEIRKALEENIKLNDLEGNIFPISNCISSTNSTLKMSFDKKIFTMTKISETEGDLEVEALTVDSLIERHNIKKVDLIKLDIEGAERVALEGAKTTLKKFKPKLALSGYHLVDDVYYLVNQLLDIQPEYKIVVGSNMHIYAF